MDLKKKIIISLISFWGIGIILALVFVSILALQRNLTISRVQASPGPACQVPDDLEVTKGLKVSNFTNSKLVAPESWNFSPFFNGGSTGNFTLNTAYTKALVFIRSDASSDWDEFGFYNAAGAKVAACQYAVNGADRTWDGGAICITPTTAVSVKITDGGASGRSDRGGVNLVVITYIP